MRTYRILSFALMALAAIALAQEGVVLRRELKNDAVDRYTTTISTKQNIESPAGDQEVLVDVTMKVAFKTTNVNEKKDSAALSIEASEMELKLGGVAAMAEGMMGEMPKSYSVTAKVDNRNQIKDAKLLGLTKQQQMMVGGLQSITSLTGIAYPEASIKVGESWDVQMSKNPLMGTEATTLKATLVGEKVVDSIAVWEISFGGKLPVNLDVSTLMGEGDATGGAISDTKMVMKGTTVMKATLLIEKITGRLIAMDGTLNSDQIMEMPDMGMTIPVKGTTKTSMKLAK